MTHLEALKHIRVLINAASESDDIDLIYKHLRMMRTVVNKAIPGPTLRQREAAKKKRAKKPALRVVK